ncbi:MAG: histidine kinase [Propionicimonas sp.]|uniref:sensor histidine kinase n=1 Tax=Propionicimonas sp. TaxID=1955623 RepID=UPI002B21C79E|nr:histidine kinase [Propionicimonas sp.]MEA4943332.1 histidine kinase [Propionicimonas sp.]MEA5055430.1 histidine kinase [Propionicimonas sp.]MEA5118078.1 histidine kinase [Propionicimonas sp.]
MRFGRSRSPEAEAVRAVEQLTASRRVIVDAYEIERRRIERDLHDGTQQYLVAAAMLLGEARTSPSVAADADLGGLLEQAQEALAKGLDALRATVRGIHPQVLVEQGLAAALTDVAQASAAPVRIVCPHPLPRLPEGVLAASYFFACEAIANAAKHAPGAPVTVLLTTDSHLRVSVMDTGPGGARLRPGHGLAGMRERLAAFGGELSISSPPGGPTQVVAAVPLLLHRGEPGVAL